jgi:preprotein translocase subunit SecF
MLRGLRLIPAETNVQFVPYRRIFFALSVCMVVASIALFAIRGLNYGIDFVGGLLIEVRTEGPADIAAMRGQLSGLGLGDVSLQEFGAENEVLIRIQKQEGGEAAQQRAVEAVRGAFGDTVEYRRIEFVGPQVSEELFWDGVTAVAIAMVLILFYIWFRFEWQFGLCAVIALMHDVVTTIGMFSLLGLEFNLSTVAAVLTIAGYSINDTVVVFDRVREDLRKYKSRPLPELYNEAINRTLARTTITGVTTLLAVAALYVFGGEVIRGFSFAILFGVVIGTYSSICVAVPLLLSFSVRRSAVAGEAEGDTAGEPG